MFVLEGAKLVITIKKLSYILILSFVKTCTLSLLDCINICFYKLIMFRSSVTRPVVRKLRKDYKLCHAKYSYVSFLFDVGELS